MKIIIIRHGEVDFRWSGWCTSEEFDKECCEYDIAPIKNLDLEIPEIKYRSIYISSLLRSRDTAKMLFAEEELKETELIKEVPLRSSVDTGKKMPLWFWNLSGRLQWLVNSTRQSEGRRQTRIRAREFVDLLLKDEVDCAVITHGFYMHTLLREMNKAGFRTSKAHAAYKNGEYVVAERL